jgi:hypothetical protein
MRVKWLQDAHEIVGCGWARVNGAPLYKHPTFVANPDIIESHLSQSV